VIDERDKSALIGRMVVKQTNNSGMEGRRRKEGGAASYSFICIFDYWFLECGVNMLVIIDKSGWVFLYLKTAIKVV